MNQRLKLLQQLPIIKEDTTIPERVARVENLLLINKQTIQLTTDNLKLANDYQAALTDEIKNLEFWHSNFVLEQKLVQIKTLKEKLNRQLLDLYENINNQPNKRSKQAPLSSSDYEAKLLINNQNIAVVQNRINALNIQRTLVKGDMIYLKNPDTKIYN